MTIGTHIPTHTAPTEAWPALPFDGWKDTYETVHLYLQIVGKVKLALCPFLNQWWQVALHLTARGLTTGPIPWHRSTFDVEFDFIDHVVWIRASDGRSVRVSLEPRSVADFYRLFQGALNSLDIEVAIDLTPSEIPHPVPFDQDSVHASYDGAFVQRWWRALLGTERVINRYRVPFHGKSSEVNLYWGGFDLNHTRFSGQPAETSSTADRIMRYSENEANFSIGFWPGGAESPAAFYAYITPAPAGIERVQIQPAAGQYVAAMGEFMLPYEAARTSSDPDEAILTFFQSAYEACAELAGWDRAALEGNFPQLHGTG